ncbi:Serine arginine-rich splicing factor 2 [Dionaea muscipula]
MDDWRPVLRRYARRQGYAGQRQGRDVEFSVFVDDIPTDMELNDVRRVFKNFGIVTDVFLPRKKSVRGTRFGFVRYNCEVAAWMAVEKGNGLWIEDKRLEVNMAASGRMRRPTGPHAQDNQVRPEKAWFDGKERQSTGVMGRGGCLEARIRLGRGARGGAGILGERGLEKLVRCVSEQMRWVSCEKEIELRVDNRPFGCRIVEEFGCSKVEGRDWNREGEKDEPTERSGGGVW